VVISKNEFSFDYEQALGWCWRRLNSKQESMDTAGLAEHLIKRALELHEQFRSGKKVRHREAGADEGGWMA
jgi:hypothetical protein